MKKFITLSLVSILTLTVTTACSDKGDISYTTSVNTTDTDTIDETDIDLESLTLLYTNDIHSHVEPFIYRGFEDERKVGGFANITSYVNGVENEVGSDILFVDAGDYFTGPSISTLTEGEAVIDIMNTMNYDVVTIGNHEFDYGWENMQDQLEKAEFEIVQGNIFEEATDELVWGNPYTIVNKNGINIGIIGLHGEFAFYDTVAASAREGLVAKDEEEYLQKYIDELEGKVDLVVLLVHEGVPAKQSSLSSVDVERSLQKDIELAQSVDGLDILITGHAHVGTPEPIVAGDTIIVSTFALGAQVGRLDLEIDTTNDDIVNYEFELKTIYDDEHEGAVETQEVIETWNEELEVIMSEVVGYTDINLTRSYGDDSLLGNLSADALYFSMQDFNSDFAVINSGGLRVDIESGEITYGDVMSLVPFPNELVVVELTGDKVMELFEHAASLTNGVLQVSSHVKMTYDTTLPEGERVTELLINGEEIQDDNVYRVTTIDFLADGGDGFLTFTEGENRETRGGYMLYVAVTDYITYLTENNAMPTTSEDRIVVVE